MANEGQFYSYFTVNKSNVNFRAYPTSFNVDVTSDGKGPSPGAVTATVAGVNVSLSELTTPGLCRIRNLGTNTVHYGIHDGTNFFPFGEVRGGCHVDFILSSFFGDALADTGTADEGDVNLRVLAENSDTDVTVEAFEA